MSDSATTPLRDALVGGGIAAGLMAAGVLGVGLSGLGSDPEALLDATLPVARTLFSTAMITSSTTLTLMLAMLGMTTDESIEGGFYDQIRLAATIAVGVFSVGTVLVLVLVIPFRPGAVGGTTYTVLFYVIAGVGALVGGALVAVMVTIHGAISKLIGLVDDDADSDIAADGDDD